MQDKVKWYYIHKLQPDFSGTLREYVIRGPISKCFLVFFHNLIIKYVDCESQRFWNFNIAELVF